ncbi:MAG: glycosyltransferase family 2 protein [Gorillibacterium sp.]|nr:glycosyltransferase family 2 protein [Gorillibacterium sp.]
MDLSIIVLNYNTRQLTLNALESVYQSETTYLFEVILIDNASSDGTVEAVREQYPHVLLIENEQNVGFARANNQAMRIAKGRYVLLLNSDTIVHPNTLDMMLSFMEENPSVGASGCKIVLPDGSLDKACKRGFPTPAASFYYAFGLARMFPRIAHFNGYQLGHLNPDQSQPIDCLVGAFMLVRHSVIDQVGMLDEQFFMYGEDIDWCYRIKQAGWQIYYYPKVEIVHYKGASSRRKPVKIVYEFHRAMFIFHRKHYSSRYFIWTNGLVYVGIAIKLGIALVVNYWRRIGGT